MVTPAESKGLDEREGETKKSGLQAGVVECPVRLPGEVVGVRSPV